MVWTFGCWFIVSYVSAHAEVLVNQSYRPYTRRVSRNAHRGMRITGGRRSHSIGELELQIVTDIALLFSTRYVLHLNLTADDDRRTRPALAGFTQHSMYTPYTSRLKSGKPIHACTRGGNIEISRDWSGRWVARETSGSDPKPQTKQALSYNHLLERSSLSTLCAEGGGPRSDS
jgi:hypothetical protein